jgi:hypothetical protein
MQALLTAYESRGYPVSTTTDDIRVTVFDESLGFGIVESTKPIEQKLIDRGPDTSWRRSIE